MSTAQRLACWAGGIALAAGLALLAGCSDGSGGEAERTAETVEPEPAPLPGGGEDAGRTVIYRDTWGIPHIYAPTVVDGFYAMGYAQAEDRPTQILTNFKIALGELAEIAGESQVPQDLIAHMFEHHGIAERQWPDLPRDIRERLQAFADGINAFYAEHPEDLPAWWGERPVTPQMVAAFGRMFLYNWSIDEALGDLRRGGIDPGFVSPRRASNQWAVSPQRSASGNALLLIDPHLSWWGVSRFWEVRLHIGNASSDALHGSSEGTAKQSEGLHGSPEGGQSSSDGEHGSSEGTAKQSEGLHGSGVTLAGNPYLGLGHNANLAWAMTTGGPDTGDVFALEINPQNPDQYRFDDGWRDFEERTVTLRIRDQGERTFTLRFSHQGPIVAATDDTAYAAAIPYDEDANPMLVWEALNFAEDYRGAVAAGESLAMFPQNLMAADTSGNIYYQRSGRVPVRPEGFDYSRPVDGSTSASAWQGLHPASDHLQVLNPEQGYMQNCNIPPDAMMVDSPFSLDAQPGYLFSSANYGPALDGWTNQRGARAVALLAADDSVTVQEALEYAVDVKPHGVERWLAALDAAVPADAEQRGAVDAQLDWDGRLDRDSHQALRYGYWRLTLAEHELASELGDAIDDHYAVIERREPAPVDLTDAHRQALAATFADALARMDSELGTTNAPWGRVFRVGRDDRSWPVGGGGGDEYGLTTLRTMGYDEPNERHERWGNRGQTSTQVVELSTPIRSWVYLPVGQSDRPGSPHYTDQAEQLFSERTIKPSWWRPEELAGHIESRVVLVRSNE